MSKIKDCFKNQKILITGHTGFKGSWLSSVLSLSYDAKIVGFSDKVVTKPAHYDLIKRLFYADVRGDISSKNSLKILLSKYKPKFIFHLAAQSLVKNSYQNPYETFQANTIGTLNLLEALRESNLKTTVIIITSDKAYENIEIKRGYKESDRLGGKDPYSGSKGAAELIIKSYFHSFLKSKKNIKIGVARAGNVIGGGDWSANRLIPDAIRAWRDSKEMLIRNPNSTRPWQHVLEPISGYLMFSRALFLDEIENGIALNFGPPINQSKSSLEVIKFLSNELENFKWRVNKRKNQIKEESELLFLDSKKAFQHLSWKTHLNTEQAVKLSSEWYKNYYSKKKNTQKAQTTFDQIHKYTTKFYD